jgi:hypothetical protein
MGKIRNTRTTRTRKPRKAPSQPRGLRIQLKGSVTLPELHAMLLDALHRLGDLGITHARGVNLYLTPATGDGTAVTPVANGQAIKQITIEPYRSAADEHGA